MIKEIEKKKREDCFSYKLMYSLYLVYVYISTYT